MNLPRTITQPTPRVLRQFGSTWFVVALAASLQRWLGRGDSQAGTILATVALVGLLGVFFPRIIKPLFVVASLVTYPIGWVVTQVVLAVLFFVVLLPLALVFRAMRRDVLRIRDWRSAPSLWKDRPKPPTPRSYLSQF